MSPPVTNASIRLVAVSVDPGDGLEIEIEEVDVPDVVAVAVFE
jgi:hypothetical protein